MDKELDIRLDITGLHIRNKDEMIEEIDKSIKDLSEILDIPLTNDEAYKAYKDVRKMVKDERNKIWNDVKEKVADVESAVLADRKELFDKYDDIYQKLDDAIHSYEEEYEIGSFKAKKTRAMNKQLAEDTANDLSITIVCPSEEVKARIMQFANDLGATIL